MNRNFKVVFSKARGALMVVNEATSSVRLRVQRPLSPPLSLRSLSALAWLRLLACSMIPLKSARVLL